MGGDASGRVTGRLQYLDAIRGLAALEIAIVFHFKNFAAPVQPGGAALSVSPIFSNFVGRALSNSGDLAVDLFFIISGIIFCYVYFDSVERKKVTAREFFARRLTRLYPIHILTFGLAAALAYGFFAASGRFTIYQINDASSAILNVLFLQSGTIDHGFSFNAPSWSLSIEAILYVLFFWGVRLGFGYRGIFVMLIVGLALYGLSVDMPVARGLVGFSLGAFLYRWVVQDGKYLMAVAVCSVCCALLLSLRWKYDIGTYTLPLAWTGSVFAICIVHRTDGLRRLLTNAFFRWLGDASLSIYMVHVPLQMAVIYACYEFGTAVPISNPIFFIMYALSVIGAAFMTERYFERPIRVLLRRALDTSRSRNALGDAQVRQGSSAAL